MGAIRFKKLPEGDFLDNNPVSPTPPWSSLRELQYGAQLIESSEDIGEIKKWLALLMALGSSLGRARPKANIVDENNHPWIAKFPSKNDTFDKGAWEYLAYCLAIKAGIAMAESIVEKITGPYHTFFTKRFDRSQQNRIHFAPAMTMTGKSEEIIRDDIPSYLDIVEFIQFSGSAIQKDLTQLWRRLVFNILISNTDDHLRNHGFILSTKGWQLSPAFDINPQIDKDGLALNIDTDSNELSLDLAQSAGIYFGLELKDMKLIIAQVKDVASTWKPIASQIGIPRNEQLFMEGAFRI